MKCVNCGSETPDDSDFCIMCGARCPGGAGMSMSGAGPPGGMGEPPYGGGRSRGEAPPSGGGRQPYVEEPGRIHEDMPTGAREPGMKAASRREYDERVRDGEWGSPIVGILTTVAGLVVFLMAWTPWVRGVTGWGLMTTSGRSGNFLWRIEPGRNVLLFTGFWALLAGALLIIGGIAMIFRHKPGGGIATVGGLIGTLVGIANLVMVYRLGTAFTLTTGFDNISPSAGLWIFTIVSAVALVHGILGIEGVDNPANDSLSARTLPGSRYQRMGGAHG